MPSYRKGRINEAIARELCVALRDARDPVIAEAFVSVTRAEAAPDLKIARSCSLVGFSSFQDSSHFSTPSRVAIYFTSLSL